MTTEEEQAARNVEQYTIEQNAVASHWDMENISACVCGMPLVKRFADASPAGLGWPCAAASKARCSLFECYRAGRSSGFRRA